MSFNASRVTADAFIVTPSTNGATKFTAFGFTVIGTAGQAKNVQVITSRGTKIPFTGLPVGTTIALAISACTTTNTTATTIVAYGPQ